MSFGTGDHNLLDDWLAVASARSLTATSKECPKVASLLGAEISLWRDADGAVRASASGRDLVVQERYCYVWVCPGGQPARELFAFPEFNEPGRRIVDCGGIGVHVSGLRVIENFLDMAHFPYVHPEFLGQVPHTEVTDYTVRASAGGSEIEAIDCRFWQPRGSVGSGGIDAAYRYRVMQPFSAILYKTCTPYPDRMDAIALFVQPLDEERCIAHCLLVYFDNANTDTQLIAFQQTIFAQDKPILENHHPRRMPLESRLEAAMPADRMSVAYRRWLHARGFTYGVAP